MSHTEHGPIAPKMFLFVSHVSEDRDAALAVVAELERRGMRCWIAPRDVRPGKPFDDEIADAIDASAAMLLIFSERCNDSEYIRREVTVAGESHKVIIPFRIEDASPRRGLRVRLSDLHWIDGFVSRDRAIDDVMRTFGPAQAAARRTSTSSTVDRTVDNEAGARTDQVRRREAEAKAEQHSAKTPLDAMAPQPSRHLRMAALIGAAAVVVALGVWVAVALRPAAIAQGPAPAPAAPAPASALPPAELPGRAPDLAEPPVRSPNYAPSDTQGSQPYGNR